MMLLERTWQKVEDSMQQVGNFNALLGEDKLKLKSITK